MKTNVLKLSIVIVAAVTSILVSCSKNDVQNPINDFVNPKEQIGKQHNEELKFILENVAEIPSAGEVKSYVEKILRNKDAALKSTVSLASIPDFPENIDELDLNSWLNEFSISIELKNEITKTFELFQTAQSLNEILEEIKLKELNASNIFQGHDLELYYEHLAVAKHTSIFWYPLEQGGMNGIQYLNASGLKSASTLKSTSAVNWWKVLGVDCVGGMMGAAVGYAGASAISVIMQL